jgi:endoglucanase
LTEPRVDLDLLQKLVDAPGLPGREDPVAALIAGELRRCGCSPQTDRLGNLVAHVPGSGPRVMLMAHMDEVGLVVQRILPDGFLKVERLGGMSVQALPGSRLTLWTAGGPLPAQVGLLPQHLDNRTAPGLADLYVDIGAGSRQEVEALGVRVGDGLTWPPHLERLGETRVAAKALDDRLGCLVLLQLVRRLSQGTPANDLYLAFNVQEEGMLMGGKPLVQAYDPEFLIGVDGTLTFDTPDLDGQQSDIRLGGGPAIKWMDGIRGRQVAHVPNYRLARSVEQCGRSLDIPLQAEVITGLSTNLTPLTFAGQGARSLGLSIPIRYHHSAIETADLRDVSALGRLLEAFLDHPIAV